MSNARNLANRHTRMVVCSSSNVANGGFAAAQYEAVPFATDVVDTNSAFTGEASTDTNNGGVFTVPVDGTYFIAVNQSVTCTTTNRLTQARLRLMLNTTGDILYFRDFKNIEISDLTIQSGKYGFYPRSCDVVSMKNVRFKYCLGLPIVKSFVLVSPLTALIFRFKV